MGKRSELIPGIFNDVNVEKLQATLNQLSDEGKKWLVIPVSKDWDVLTESALLNALDQLGTSIVFERVIDGQLSGNSAADLQEALNLLAGEGDNQKWPTLSITGTLDNDTLEVLKTAIPIEGFMNILNTIN